MHPIQNSSSKHPTLLPPANCLLYTPNPPIFDPTGTSFPLFISPAHSLTSLLMQLKFHGQYSKHSFTNIFNFHISFGYNCPPNFNLDQIWPSLSWISLTPSLSSSHSSPAPVRLNMPKGKHNHGDWSLSKIMTTNKQSDPHVACYALLSTISYLLSSQTSQTPCFPQD